LSLSRSSGSFDSSKGNTSGRLYSSVIGGINGPT
jgi:hypothetical protein